MSWNPSIRRDHRHAHARPCNEQPGLVATPTTEIHEIAHVMLDEQVSAIPILDSSRHLVGILTTSDILRAIVDRSPLELWT